MRIRHVDAFTTEALTGNPAAVVDGDNLTADLMQRIALNQNLSETVFLLPPEDSANSAHIRIFTPRSELPFAGHPTLAAAHILREERIAMPVPGQPLLLETGAGVIPVALDGAPTRYTMTQAAPQFRAAASGTAAIAAALGIDEVDVVGIEDVSTGIWWTVAQVASLEAMIRVRPRVMLLQDVMFSVFCLGTTTDLVDIRVRAFAPGQGIVEDPVTGSANGCIGAFIAKHRLLPVRDGEIAYVGEQGIEIGQAGRVYVRVSDPDGDMRVHVGGHAVTVLRGDLLIE